MDLSIRIVARWEKQEGLRDKRKTADRLAPKNKLTEEERKMILTKANSEQYCDLPPSKIVPLLADEGIYIASESSFYRVLREEKQLTHRQATKVAKRHKPRECVAYKANQCARAWTEKFASWYNTKHLHSALKFVTPRQRHTGEDIAILENRHEVYKKAKERRPERWAGKTRNWIPDQMVTLNPDKKRKKFDSNIQEISEAA